MTLRIALKFLAAAALIFLILTFSSTKVDFVYAGF
jgi:hypothetical protein